MTFRPDSLILYVDDTDVSTNFYADLLEAEPVERVPDFSVFALGGGFVLGLQSRHAIDPRPQPGLGGTELCFGTATVGEVDALHAEWAGKGVAMAMAPTWLAFGYTFVATDPDGHRLRVCAVGARPA